MLNSIRQISNDAAMHGVVTPVEDMGTGGQPAQPGHEHTMPAATSSARRGSQEYDCSPPDHADEVGAIGVTQGSHAPDGTFEGAPESTFPSHSSDHEALEAARQTQAEEEELIGGDHGNDNTAPFGELKKKKKKSKSKSKKKRPTGFEGEFET